MTDLGWLLLWMSIAGYVVVGLAAFLAGAIWIQLHTALCAVWRRLRRLFPG